MSKRKISSYFQRETNKIIDKAEEKNWKRISQGGKRCSTSEFETLQFPDEMVEWILKVSYFSLGSRKTIYWIGQRQFNVIINYALPPAIAYLSLCKSNRGTNCLMRQLSWLKHCCIKAIMVQDLPLHQCSHLQTQIHHLSCSAQFSILGEASATENMKISRINTSPTTLCWR